MSETRVKIIPTKVGTVWEAARKYKLLDYLVIDGATMYLSKKVDDSGVNLGHSLTNTDWWEKCIDLADVVEKAKKAIDDCEQAGVGANDAATQANAAAQNAQTQATKAASAGDAAMKATKLANDAAQAANTATEGANTVNAKLGKDNVLMVTDREGNSAQVPLGDAADVARMKQSLGPYSDRPDIVLAASQTGYVVSKDGVKTAKAGWAMAEFTAELGNEYLFKPGATDGSVCVFAEYIDKVERRAIEYAYTYDEKGRVATAKATYDGKTHSYTYAYTTQESTAATGTEAQGEVCVITDDQTGQTVDYLPATFQTKVGSYQPLTLLNADAELPVDGYCRFVSNFQARSAIKVVVSYKVDVADLTMKVVRDGMTASMCTQLSKINQKVDEAKAGIEELKDSIVADSDYYVAENDEKTGDPHFQNGKGNKDILNDWHFFLIDHTDNTGDATHPVGQLMDNNFFRFVGGAFATTVGITEEMRAACDVQLYTDAEHTQKLTLKNGVVVTDKAGAHPYNAVEVYNSLGLVMLYDGEGRKVRQLLPWETTETKYSVMLGRYDTLYPIDRQTGKSGKVISGIFTKPVRYDGIDAGRFPLLGTAIAPCPVTTVGNKTRNFFFAYAVGDTNTTNNGNPQSNDLCSVYLDGRTYPRTSDMNQITTMQRARANNADTTAPVPFAEGGYHALNTFTMCMELLYGTKYLHDNNLFGSGISSNDPCNNETTWLNNGGVRCKEQGTADWGYYTWGANTPFGYNNKMQKYNFSGHINYYMAKEECMESQMAASWAAEMGVAEDTEFEAYGATYHYKNIPGVKGLKDGEMNCKVYRTRIGTCKGYKDADTLATYDLEIQLRMSLIHGMNLSGDIFAYWGGGCEMVGTNKVTTNGSYNAEQLEKNFVEFYLEPYQDKWVNETNSQLNELGIFGFEAVYNKIGIFGPPILSDGYAKKRLGFTPYKIENGGGIGSGQGFYGWTFPYWSRTLNQRVLIAVRCRGNAYDSLCAPRSLHAGYAVSSTYVIYGGSAQCRIVQRGAV